MVALGSVKAVIINHCQFFNNSADDGGAVVITDYHTIYLSNLEFKNNTAYHSGGAIKPEGTRKGVSSL